MSDVSLHNLTHFLGLLLMFFQHSSTIFHKATFRENQCGVNAEQISASKPFKHECIYSKPGWVSLPSIWILFLSFQITSSSLCQTLISFCCRSECFTFNTVQKEKTPRRVKDVDAQGCSVTVTFWGFVVCSVFFFFCCFLSNRAHGSQQKQHLNCSVLNCSQSEAPVYHLLSLLRLDFPQTFSSGGETGKRCNQADFGFVPYFYLFLERRGWRRWFLC